MVLADDEVERALVVVAHPDDADFWAGGTIAGWTSAGIAVTYCVLSDGDSGGFDPRGSPVGHPRHPPRRTAGRSRRARRV